ncbi:type 2 periplasmic-binding domain-containing protein [Lapidilactobacillus salsurivasis]
MKKSKIALLATAAAAIALILGGCGKSSETSNKTAAEKDDGKLMKITVYDDLANYQGNAKGWFAKMVKDKFNIEMNIVAPNVAGGGSTLFDTRSAAGNLGDIIITGSGNGRAKKLVKAGLISDMTPYLKGMKYIKQYSGATDALQKVAGQTSGVWGVPSSVSSASPTSSSEGTEPTFGPYIRWDYYKKIGYPAINNMDDMVSVLKDMQAEARKENPGKKIYALSLFKDWDGNMMNNAKQPTCFYGYDELGFVLAKANGDDFQDITQTNGQYVKALRFFNKAEQAGLVDPESSTQNYDTMYAKYQEGNVLFSFWPWLGQAAFNTTANKEAGKGFMIAPLKNMKIFSYGNTTNGTQTFIAIGSKAKNKQRLVKFINWLYSPEGVAAAGAQTGGTSGPEGLTWKMKDGEPVLTDFGKKVFLEGGANVPAKWGSGKYTDGVSQLNYPAVAPNDINPETKYSYSYTLWPSVLKATKTALDTDWSDHMGGATTTMDYLKKNKKILVAPGASYVTPEESSEISSLRGQIKTQIVNESWKMVFAKNDSEFDSMLTSMQKTVKGLDYASVLKVDMKNAKDQNKERVAIKKEYANK